MHITTKITRGIRVLWPMGVVLLALTAGSGTLWADAANADLAGRVETARKDASRHRRARDAGAMNADLQRAQALYEEAMSSGDEAAAKKLVSLVGALTKVRDQDLRLRALALIGTLGHEDGARYLKSHLRPLKDAKGAPLTLAAIEASGKVGSDKLVPALLKVADKSKHMAVAAAAISALGKFGDSRRYREHILEELVDSLRRDKPGGYKRGRESQVADTYIPGKNGSAGTARWNTLAPLLPRALNELTGQNVPSTLDWIETVRSHRDLGDLFTD